MEVQPIKTTLYRRDQNLLDFIFQHLSVLDIPEGSILCITSKIVSLAEQRLASRSENSKLDLIKKESDIYLGPVAHGSHLSVKHGNLVISAGIDESNSTDDQYILYPEAPYQSAHRIWLFLKEKLKKDQLGVILTDSHTRPLRKGVSGFSLAHWGFHGIENRIGSKDLFGRELKMTQSNWADPLAAVAVMVMGEGAESCPLALIRDAGVRFYDQKEAHPVSVEYDEDLYLPLLEAFRQASKS